MRPITEGQLRALVERVAAARQLPPKRRVRLNQVNDLYFTKLAGRDRVEGSSDDDGSAEAFLLGFSLASPRSKAGRGASSASEVPHEQIVGFYDVRRDTVVVRLTPPRSEQEAIKHRAILAHEIHHALQHQHFDLPKQLPNADAELAVTALVEGDAQVAMGAYIGAEQGAPVRRTLRMLKEVTGRVSLDEISHKDQGSEKLSHALPIFRARLTFPYVDGMRFVTDLYRAGGFRLVDRAYSRLPDSTEQVLHPDKYIAGERPTEVADPRPPSGYERVHVGRMGELQIRVALEACVGADQARKASEGWGGDAFTLADPSHNVAMLWSTVWDAEQDAIEFADALERRPDCWGAGELTSGRAAYRIERGHTTLRKGAAVAFVRGLPDRTREQVAKQLWCCPKRLPPRSPRRLHDTARGTAARAGARHHPRRRLSE